jgi:transposase
MANGQQRDSKREAYWRGVMKRLRRSGLTARAFCARETLSEPSFYHWRRVLRQRDAERAAPGALPGAPAFVPVVVSDAAAERSAGVEIEVRGEFRSCVVRLPAVLPIRQVAELVHAIAAARPMLEVEP